MVPMRLAFSTVCCVVHSRQILGAQIEFASHDGILHANGEPFSFKGVTWKGAAGPNDLPDGLAGPYAHDIHHYMKLLSMGSFNAIRVEFNHEAVLQDQTVKNFNPKVEPGLIGMTYVQALELIAQHAEQEHILVVLACTQLTPYAQPGNGLWHNGMISEQDSLRSWWRLASVLCSQSNVIAVDLLDEPHGGTWGFGPLSTDWHAAAERIAQFVQGVCPRWLIMVQGARSVPWSQEVPENTPGQNLVGVHTKQIHLEDSSKLVYSQRIAPPSQHLLAAYKDIDFPGNMPAIWGRQFGFVSEETGAALVVGSVGGSLMDALDTTWLKAVFAWIQERKIGFFYDSMNPNLISGGLLHKDWGSLREQKLALLSGLVGTPTTRCVVPVVPACSSCSHIAGERLCRCLVPSCHRVSSTDS